MKFKYKHHDGYFLLVLSETYDYNQLMAAMDNTLKICIDSGYSKLLIDSFGVDFTTVPDMARFYFGEKLAVFTEDSSIKIAFLMEEQNFTHFGENVAVNRGAFTKVFHGEKEAVEWLLNRQ